MSGKSKRPRKSNIQAKESEETQKTPGSLGEKDSGETEQPVSFQETLPPTPPEPSLEEQLTQTKDKYLRALAELDNFRKRAALDRQQAVELARENLLIEILALADDFERALNSIGGQGPGPDLPREAGVGISTAQRVGSSGVSHNAEAVVEGVRLIYKRLREFLERQGVEPIEALGQAFDPNYHEAAERVATTEHLEGTVIEEVQKGYKLNTRVLRAARVKVAAAPT